MKPATTAMLRGLLALLHAAFMTAPNRRATAAVLRSLASEAQRVASKLERTQS